jgi:hypothetical protein
LEHLDGLGAPGAEAGHIYWTNMGVPNLNDGSIERSNIDGKNRRVIVPQGGTFTPKQIHLDKKSGKLYWSDREEMRVMRSNLDGSQIETLVEAGRGDADRRDQTKWCVGITVDPVRKQIYWTQKGPDNAGLGRWRRELRSTATGFAQVMAAPGADEGAVTSAALEIEFGRDIRVRIAAAAPKELACAIIKVLAAR